MRQCKGESGNVALEFTLVGIPILFVLISGDQYLLHDDDTAHDARGCRAGGALRDRPRERVRRQLKYLHHDGGRHLGCHAAV